MPSTSPSQQRLMGQAYAVRQFMDSGGKKGLNPNEVDVKYKEKIEDLAKNMSKEDLKDFATKLEENSPTATLGSVNGMGSVSLPGADGKTGSGDIPNSLNKKKRVFKQFKEFTVALQESSNWDDVADEHGAKSDIYTLFKRKTKIKDARDRIMKQYKNVTANMFDDVWFKYKNEK